MFFDHFRRCRRSAAKRTMALHQVFFGGERQHVHPGLFESLVQPGFPLAGSFAETGAEFPVVGIHVKLFAGFGIFHDDRADVRQLHFTRVPQAHRQHLVAPVEQIQRAFPARGADEIRNDENQRALLDGVQPAFEAAASGR